MDLSALRADAPVLQRYTYLNTAASGILTRSQAAWRQEQDEAFVAGASLYRAQIFEQLSGVVDSLAQTFGGDARRMALLPNYTLGMNMIAEALPASSVVLTDSHEYPSVVLPLTARGHHVTKLPLTASSLPQILDSIEHHSATVIAVSIVQWLDGGYIPVEFFKVIKDRFPDVLILADGTQYMGTAPFCFEGSGIDILMSSAYKWLMGGYGCGFMMLSDGAIDRLRIVTAGNATQIQRLFTGEKFAAQLFQPGHLDYLNFGTMQLGVETLHTIGLQVVRSQIRALALHLKTQLVELGLLPEEALTGNYHTGILHIGGSQALVDRLAEQGVIVSMREGVRVSFHAYNTLADIDRFVEAVEAFSS